jgi:hypothetical protein
MTGELDAGLFFVWHIRHTSSAAFAVPPGARSGGYVGEGLFAG